MSENAIPAAKKDMLTFALKDKELQLKLFKETLTLNKAEETAKKLEEELKKKVEEEKKEEESAEDQPAKVEPPKLSQLVL